MFKIISQIKETEIINSYYVNFLDNRFKEEGISYNDRNNFINNVIKLGKHLPRNYDFNNFLFNNIDNIYKGSFQEINNKIIELLNTNLYPEEIVPYIMKYPHLREVPVEVIKDHLSYLQNSQTGTAALKIAIFWRNYPELIENTIYDEPLSSLKNVNNFTGMDNFIIKFRDSLNSPIIKQILSNWDKIDLSELLNINNLYSEDIAPYIMMYPYLREVPIEIIRDHLLYLQNSQTGISALKIAIFWRNHPELIENAIYDKPLSYLKNVNDFTGIENFIIKFRDSLNSPIIKQILSNWDKIDLSGVDPQLVENTYNKAKEGNPELSSKDIKNIGKLLMIFGENIDNIVSVNDLQTVERLCYSFLDFNNKEDYKYIDNFLMKFRNFLEVNIIRKILSEWKEIDLTEKEDPQELILKYMPEDKRKRVQNYPVEVWPMLITSPILIGSNPRVVEDIYNKIVETGQKFSDMDIRGIGKLVSIFGNKFYDCIKSYDLKDIHNKSNYFPEFERRSDYKYMDIFLRTYKDWGDPKVKIIINNWKNFPEEIKRPPQDLGKLYNYLVEEIFPEKYRNLKTSNKDFLLEYFIHGVNPIIYNKYENIYMKSQKIPLPRWTEIEPVEFGGYKGYFVPRSDTRTMFIGDYVTCCQKIGGAAETSAIHSQVSPYGALFLVENINTGKPTAQSWVWENKGNIVFDDIECPAMKGGTTNDKIAELIMGVYKEAARRIKELGVKSVSVGYCFYGINKKYLKDLPKMKSNLIPEPEDKKSFLEDYFDNKKKLYMDSDEGKRILAKVIRISNKIDGKYSDISDKIDKLIFGWENV